MTTQKTVKKEVSSSPLLSIAKVGVLAAGGYLLWTNRFKIQKFLESQGIETPWMNGNIGEAISSGVAKLTGAAEAEVKTITQPNAFSNVAKDAQKSLN